MYTLMLSLMSRSYHSLISRYMCARALKKPTRRTYDRKKKNTHLGCRSPYKDGRVKYKAALPSRWDSNDVIINIQTGRYQCKRAAINIAPVNDTARLYWSSW